MFISTSQEIGVAALTDVVLLSATDILPPKGSEPNVSSRVVGFDPLLGEASFMFCRVAKNTAAITAGSWVELVLSVVSATPLVNVVPWAGTATKIGCTLGVIMADTVLNTTQDQYVYVQVEGLAVARTAGAPVAGSVVAWNAAGVAQPTAVATKNTVGAEYATAPSVQIGTNTGAYSNKSTNGFLLSATQALVFLNSPVQAA